MEISLEKITEILNKRFIEAGEQPLKKETHLAIDTFGKQLYQDFAVLFQKKTEQQEETKLENQNDPE